MKRIRSVGIILKGMYRKMRAADISYRILAGTPKIDIIGVIVFYIYYADDFRYLFTIEVFKEGKSLFVF